MGPSRIRENHGMPRVHLQGKGPAEAASTGPHTRAWLNWGGLSRFATRQLWPAATRGGARALCGLLLSALFCFSPASSARQRTNDELPEKYRKYPLSEKSLSVGLPNAGWQLRARKLRASREL